MYKIKYELLYVQVRVYDIWMKIVWYWNGNVTDPNGIVVNETANVYS